MSKEKQKQEKFNPDAIKQKAEATRKGYMKRKNAKPPMCQRLTISISGLINYCDQVLFLCKRIEVLRDENRDLKLGIRKAKNMLKE